MEEKGDWAVESEAVVAAVQVKFDTAPLRPCACSPVSQIQSKSPVRAWSAVRGAVRCVCLRANFCPPCARRFPPSLPAGLGYPSFFARFTGLLSGRLALILLLSLNSTRLVRSPLFVRLPSPYFLSLGHTDGLLVFTRPFNVDSVVPVLVSYRHTHPLHI